jgi:hypothetical protein
VKLFGRRDGRTDPVVVNAKIWTYFGNHGGPESLTQHLVILRTEKELVDVCSIEANKN